MNINKLREKKTAIDSLFVISILFILIFTMLPIPSIVNTQGMGGYNVVPLRNIGKMLTYTYAHLNVKTLYQSVINIIGNIVLFVPFGFMLPLQFRRIATLSLVAFSGFLFSFTIECTQILLPHRWVDIDDIILNSAGAVLGYAIFRMSAAISARKHGWTAQS